MAVGILCDGNRLKTPQSSVARSYRNLLSDQFVASWEELVNFDRLRRYRVDRITSALRESGLDGLLSFKGDSVRYISSLRPLIWEAGYQTRNLVVVSATGKICLYVASGDYQRVLQNNPWLNDVNPLASMEDAGISFRVVTDQLMPKLKEMGLLGGRLAVEATTFYTLDYIRKAVAKEDTALEGGDDVVLRARAIKSADEIRLLHAAGGIVDGGLFQARAAIEEGRTENAVAGAALRGMYSLGTEWMPINPIVFSGKGPLRRYATEKAILRGDLVVVNLSAMHDGYCAEATRTFTAGTPAADAAALLNALKHAYEGIFDKLTPETRIADVTSAFLDGMKAKGRSFLNIRGAGLSLAELPDGQFDRRSPASTLEKDMTLVLEARAEDPTLGVCQISDTVHIGQSGPNFLTRFQEVA